MHIEISAMQPGQMGLLANLWQYYQFESSVRERLDVDIAGRFETPEEVFDKALRLQGGGSAHLMACDGAIAGFLVLQPAEIEGKPITEFADLFVLPRYRERGVATEVIKRVILSSKEPWLIAVFRDDLKALAFWRRTFDRIPFASCREIVPPELPEFHEFVVNERNA
jgi:predicted acetyltransferase